MDHVYGQRWEEFAIEAETHIRDEFSTFDWICRGFSNGPDSESIRPNTKTGSARHSMHKAAGAVINAGN